jgi:TatD DNase family protein
MQFFDSHAHYDDEKFENDREEIIQKIYEEKVTSVVTAGYSIQSSNRAIELAKKYEYLYATCGISPNDIGENIEEDILEIEKLCENAKEKKIVAIGEIGLDYYWNKENKELQKAYFIKQIKLANKLNLPIVIHTRDAYIDTIDILKNEIQAKNKGVFHCCPLNIELVKDAIALDFYISFAGPVTFKNVKHAEEIIKFVPDNRILIETDSPYLSPEPYRGKRNDSRNVKLIAQKIAEVKQKDLEEIANLTYENTKRIFKI